MSGPLTLADVKVGDTVLMFHMYRPSGDEEATVTKVGRKLIHVKCRWGGSEVYRIENGRHNVPDAREFIRTHAEHAAHLERQQLLADLKATGIDFVAGSGLLRTLPNETIRKLIHVMAGVSL